MRKASFVGKVDINEYKCIFVVQVVRCISSNHYVQVKSIIPSQYIATMMAGDSWKKSKGHKPSLHFWDFISNEIYLIPWKRANCHCIQEKLAWMIPCYYKYIQYRYYKIIVWIETCSWCQDSNELSNNMMFHVQWLMFCHFLINFLSDLTWAVNVAW